MVKKSLLQSNVNTVGQNRGSSVWAVLVVLLSLMQLFLGIKGLSRSTASNIEGTMNIK